MIVWLYALLAGLDLTQGEWVAIGVSVHNYAPHPIQARCSAFIIRDIAVLRQMQNTWQGTTFYQDYCDYHYVLKFYKDQRLQKTIKLNLRCGYATEGVFSYTFRPEWLEQILPAAQPIVWSRVWFHRNENLKPAVQALLGAPEVYFYEEPEPYLFEGRFVIGVDSASWRTDRDSLNAAVAALVARHFPTGRAYVRPYFFYLDDQFLLYFRFEVFCDRADFERYGRTLPLRVSWQPHIHPGEAKRLIIIGVNRERFWAYVRRWRTQYQASADETP